MSLIFCGGSYKLPISFYMWKKAHVFIPTDMYLGRSRQMARCQQLWGTPKWNEMQTLTLIHQPYWLNMQVPLYLLVLQIGSCEIPNNSLDLPGPLLAGRRDHIRVRGGKWEEQNLLSRLSFEASPSNASWDLNCMRQFRFLAEFLGGIYIYSYKIVTLIW